MDSGEEDDIYVDSEDEDEILHFSGDDTGPGSRSFDKDIAPCQTLTPDMISQKMFQIIKEVNDVFQVRGFDGKPR